MFRLPVRFVALVALAGFLPRAVAQIQMTTTRVASGLSLPLFVTAPPGDTSRLFIAEQGANSTAKIRILDLATNIVLPTPFLTLNGISAGGERGLLGLAFHPDYASNGYFYVYVSDTSSSNSVLRFTVSGVPNVADPASRRNVMVMADPFANHNGGWIGFGPDRFLYIATGDSGTDPQDIHNPLGKMLRIDVNGDDFPSDPNANYAIPPSNPFAGISGAREVWHYGLRNPWRASFDRATGDLYVGDVGWGTAEEIDFQPAGTSALNFGWPCMEGNGCTGLQASCTCNAPSLTLPVTTYPHGMGCAVMGGYVYRGNALCGLQGTYFFGDYCSARIWSFRKVPGGITGLTDRTAELRPPGSLTIGLISSFGEDANGELYICDQSDGEIYRIVPGAAQVDCNHNGVEDSCDIANGTSRDLNGDGIPDECAPSVTRMCFGDGTGGACPCSNRGAPDHGCQNSANSGGALLTAVGRAELSNDTMVMTSTGELPSALSICLQGDAEIAPHGFGDGLRCAGGQMKRLYVKHAVGGVAVMPVPGDPSVSARSAALGNPIAPGSVRIYQVYYRDPSSTFCPNPPGDTFNASGGLRAVWGI